MVWDDDAEEEEEEEEEGCARSCAMGESPRPLYQC
jgi:hypothetical protein